jgi:hypothetical protein
MRRNTNRRIAVQTGLDIKQDPISKTTKAKRAGCGSSGQACLRPQVQSPAPPKMDSAGSFN